MELVNGPLQISAVATDNIGVTSVQFFYDDTLIGTDAEGPYDVLWNAGTLANGVYTIIAKAFDAAGNAATSPAISITINYPMPTPEPAPTPPDTYQLSVSNFESYNGFLVYESSVLGSYNVSINHGNRVFYVESNYGTISVTLSHTTGSGTTSQSFSLSNGEYRGVNVPNGDYVLVSMSNNSNLVQFAFVFDPV